MNAPLLLLALLAALAPCRPAAATDCPNAADAGPYDRWLADPAGARPMCYRAFQGPATAEGAAAACAEHGATLASIADDKELAWAIEVAHFTKPAADDPWSAHMVHVGLKKSGGQWANPDGADASFLLTKWGRGTGEPSGDGDCVEMSVKGSGIYLHIGGQLVGTFGAGDLNDRPCGAGALPYVCGKLAP